MPRITLKGRSPWIALIATLACVTGIWGPFPIHAQDQERYEHPAFEHSVPELIDPESDNPFLRYERGAGNKYHPFADYTGAHGIYGDEIALDYFGFRNDADLYFDEERDYTLIVITGGSEMAGFSHRITVAEHLERILNEQGDRRFKVLNLGINSYCLPQEISTYVHFAYHLKPEIVISHTAWNDFIYARLAPLNFKKLGLSYPSHLEMWIPRIYGERPPGEAGRDTRGEGFSIIVDRFLRKLDDYRRIVGSNGGKLIVGIQGYDPIRAVEDPFSRTVPDLYEELKQKVKFGLGLHDFTGIDEITFGDAVHSTEKASRVIAEIYARLVTDALKTDE